MGPEHLKCEIRVPEPKDAGLLQQLVNNAAARHFVSATEVIGRSRDHAVTEARVEVWQVLRERGWSFSRIAREFSRDHTSVMQTLRAREGIYRKSRLS